MTQRIKRHPFLALFDGPDPNASTAGRPTSTVPTQALYFLNDPFVHARADSLATKLAALPADARLDRACRLLYGRPANDTERAVAGRFFAGYGKGDDKAAWAAWLRGAVRQQRIRVRRLMPASGGGSAPAERSPPGQARRLAKTVESPMTPFDPSRRAFVRSAVAGSVLFPALVNDLVADDDPAAPKTPHFEPKAKSVIFLFMTGGVSHVDSFDPKPKLVADHGKAVTLDHPETKNRPGYEKLFLKKPQWTFAKRGKCGTEVSDLFPNVGECVDELAVIRSLNADHSNHYNATLGMHTGSFNQARPSIGAWVSYGLGTVNQNLPSFVVIAPHTPYAGGQVWASDFLPGSHQGTHVVPGPEPMRERPAARAGGQAAPRTRRAGRTEPRPSGEARPRPGPRSPFAELRDGLRHAVGRPGGVRPRRRDGRHAEALRPRRAARRPASAGSASPPGGWSSAASASSS